jgi:putative component of toxin-antitoxin plasmid stabilization module
MELGNFGDVKPVGQGVSERRIDFGPGLHFYCMRRFGPIDLTGSGPEIGLG